jgi:hypothetical protein
VQVRLIRGAQSGRHAIAAVELPWQVAVVGSPSERNIAPSMLIHGVAVNTSLKPSAAFAK